MADNKPNNQPQNPDEYAEDSEAQQSEALKRAILKLRDQGMLKHVPDDMLDAADSLDETPVGDDSSTAQPADAQTIASRSTLQEDVPPQPDEPTLPSKQQAEVPTIATTSDATESAPDEDSASASQDVRTEVLLTGWDDVSQIPPEEDAGVLAQWDDAAEEPETTFDMMELAARTQESEQIRTIRNEEEHALVPAPDAALTGSRDETPWVLQQFFDGEIDLERELARRFPSVPLMTQIRFRTLGKTSGRHVATLQTQDGSAALIVDTDVRTKLTRFTFSMGSMVNLRYEMNSLSQHDRLHWLEIMRREGGGLAFFWGAARWQEDYLICTNNKRFATLYAFSTRHYDAAARLTAPIIRRLLEWLEDIWLTEPEPEPEPDDEDDNALLDW